MTRAERTETYRAQWAASDWGDVAAFAGPRSAAFRRAWEKARDHALAGKAAPGIGFCWPALVFGFAWFFWRRQWMAGGLLLAVPIVLGPLSVNTSGLTGVQVAMAMFAKGFYVQTAVRTIDRIRRDGGGAAEIAAAGGVSVLAGTLAGGLWLLGMAYAVLMLTGIAP